MTEKIKINSVFDDQIDILINDIFSKSKSTNNDFASYKPPKTVSELHNYFKQFSTDYDRKYNFLLTILWIFVIAVWVAIVWWLGESIFRSYTETIELRSDVLELRLKNEELKNDVEDAKKDNELLIEKKYTEFLKIQLNKK